MTVLSSHTMAQELLTHADQLRTALDNNDEMGIGQHMAALIVLIPDLDVLDGILTPAVGHALRADTTVTFASLITMIKFCKAATTSGDDQDLADVTMLQMLERSLINAHASLFTQLIETSFRDSEVTSLSLLTTLVTHGTAAQLTELLTTSFHNQQELRVGLLAAARHGSCAHMEVFLTHLHAQPWRFDSQSDEELRAVLENHHPELVSWLCDHVQAAPSSDSDNGDDDDDGDDDGAPWYLEFGVLDESVEQQG